MYKWMKSVGTSLLFAALFVLSGTVLGFAATISGTVAYSGSQAGTVYVLASTSSDFAGQPVAFSTYTVTSSINYTLSISTPGSYYVMAYIDINANQIYDSATEAKGVHGGDSVPTMIALSTIDVSGIGIIMTDPSGGTPPPGGTYSISGTVTYSGTATGTLYIKAFTSADFSGSPIGSTSASVSPTVSYTISNLSANTYYLMAFIDKNGNSTQDTGEPVTGQLAVNPVIISSANVTGKDFSLSDSSGGDQQQQLQGPPFTIKLAVGANATSPIANATVEIWDTKGDWMPENDVKLATDTSAAAYSSETGYDQMGQQTTMYYNVVLDSTDTTVLANPTYDQWNQARFAIVVKVPGRVVEKRDICLSQYSQRTQYTSYFWGGWDPTTNMWTQGTFINPPLAPTVTVANLKTRVNNVDYTPGGAIPEIKPGAGDMNQNSVEISFNYKITGTANEWEMGGVAKVCIDTNGNGSYDPFDYTKFFWDTNGGPYYSSADAWNWTYFNGLTDAEKKPYKLTQQQFDAMRGGKDWSMDQWISGWEVKNGGSNGVTVRVRWEGRDSNWNPASKGTYPIRIRVYNPQEDQNDETANLAYENTSLQVKIIGSSISGTVKDDQQNPIPNIRVNAGSQSSWGSAFTKADGSYSIGGLTSGRYHLNVETGASGFPNADLPEDIQLGDNEDITGKNFVLERGGSITGTVTIPAPGFKKYPNPWSWTKDTNDPGYWITSGWMQLNAWSPNSPQHGWTGVNVEDDGDDTKEQTVTYTLNLPPGTYNFKAEIEGFTSQLETNVEVKKGESTTKNLTLGKSGSISGIVSLPAGVTNTTGLNIDISAESADGKSFGWGGTFLPPNVTSATYKIRALSAGTYNVRYNCWGKFKPGKVENVTVAAAQDVTEADVAALNYTFDAGKSIKGKVVFNGSTIDVMTSSGDTGTNSGEGMKVVIRNKKRIETGQYDTNTFRLWINAWSQQTGYGTGVEVVVTRSATSQEVDYEITGLEDGVSYHIDTWLFGWELQERPLVASAPSTSTNITLVPFSGSVSGTVSGSGVTLANVRVIAREPWWDQWRAPKIATPDSTGAYKIEGIGTGEYIVTCNEYSVAPSTGMPFGAPSGKYGMATERVPIANGQVLTGVDFTLAAGATIQGEVTLSSTNPPLKSDGTTAYTLADIDGKVLEAYPVKMQWMGFQAAFKARVHVVGGKALYKLEGLGDDIYTVVPPVYGYSEQQMSYNTGMMQPDVAGERKSVAVKSGDTKTANFELSNGYTISGSIQRSSTNGVSGDGEDHFYVNLSKAGGEWTQVSGTSVDFMDTTNWEWLPQAERTDNTSKRSLSFTLKHIPNGNYVIHVSPWKNAYKEESKEVTIADAEVNVGAINVTQGATIKGKLVDAETGMAVTDENGIFVQCEARPWVEGSWRDSSQMYETDYTEVTSSTATDTTKFWEKQAGQKTGVFRMRNLPAGNYIVRVISGESGKGFSSSTSNKKYINQTIAGISVPDSTDEVDIGTVKLKGGVTISGNLTDSAGSRLANVMVAASPSGSKREIAPTITKSDKDGKYILEGIDPLIGYWDITAAARPRDSWREGVKAKYGEQTKLAIAPLSTDVNFILETASAYISGTVLPPSGKELALPWPGENMPVAMILLQNQSQAYADPMGGIEDITSPDGRFSIHGIVPTKLNPNGTKKNLYTMKVFSKGAATYNKRDIEITSGANSVGNIQMTGGAKIGGTVKDVDGKNVSSSIFEMPLVSTPDFSNMVFGTFTTNSATNEIERYDIDGLAAGTSYYVVLAAEEGSDIYVDTTVVTAVTADDLLERNITWVNNPPYFMAAAVKNEQGAFLLGVWATESITEAVATDAVSITANPASSVQPNVTAKGALSQLEMSLDKQEITGVFVPDASDLAFTIKVLGHDVTGKEGGGNYNFATTVDAYNVQIINPLIGGKVTASTKDPTALTVPPGAVTDPNDPTAQVNAEVSKVQEVGMTVVSYQGIARKVAVPIRNYPKAFQAVASPKASILLDKDGKVIRSNVSSNDKVSAYYEFKIGSAQVGSGKTVKVSLIYDSTKVTDTSMIDVYYLSDNGWVRENNGRTIDDTNKTISADVNHTSLFAVFKSLGGETAPSSTEIPPEYRVYTYPNPYNKKTATDQLSLKIGIPAGSNRDVKVKIFNIAGELVREISAANKAPGYHDVIWDRKNDGGQEVASGVYIAQVEAGGEEKIIKIAIIK